MFGKTSLIVIALCCLIGALPSNVASAASYAAGASGPYTSGPFSAGVFQNATDLGLSVSTPIFQTLDVGPVGDASPTVGGVTFTSSTGQFGPNLGNWGAPAPAFSDSNLNTLVVPFMVAFSANTRSTTITGLNANQLYRVQLIIWDGDSNDTNATYRGTTPVTIGSDTLTGFNDETILGGWFNNKGVYVNYDFAFQTSLTISVTPNASSSFILSALDVQYLPEPGSAGALLLVGCATLSRRMSGNRRHG